MKILYIWDLSIDPVWFLSWFIYNFLTNLNSSFLRDIASAATILDGQETNPMCSLFRFQYFYSVKIIITSTQLFFKFSGVKLTSWRVRDSRQEFTSIGIIQNRIRTNLLVILSKWLRMDRVNDWYEKRMRVKRISLKP